MTVLSRDGRNNLWFGTVDRMQWFPTPNRGADVSSQGWQDGGTMLNGGGYQLNSFGSAKNYVFEWPSSSSREVAQLLKSFSDGTYGRGLIYFLDPLTWQTNVLPAHWADPSMTLGLESPSLVPGVTPSASTTSGGDAMNLPVRSATYNLSGTGPMTPASLNESNSVFIPIPEGGLLYLGAVYSSTGSSGVYYSRVSRGGVIGATSKVPSAPAGGDPGTGILTAGVIPQPGDIGVRVWVGHVSGNPGALTLTALLARLGDQSRGGNPDPALFKPWIGGQGHSGCRFVGKPTYINYTGVDGGQVGFAASFREVGAWQGAF